VAVAPAQLPALQRELLERLTQAVVVVVVDQGHLLMDTQAVQAS